MIKNEVGQRAEAADKIARITGRAAAMRGYVSVSLGFLQEGGARGHCEARNSLGEVIIQLWTQMSSVLQEEAMPVQERVDWAVHKVVRNLTTQNQVVPEEERSKLSEDVVIAVPGHGYGCEEAISDFAYNSKKLVVRMS